MKRFPVELLQPVFQAVVDDWPYVPWADPAVLCSACTAAMVSPALGRSSNTCAAPSIHTDGSAPRNACQTMRLGWVNLTLVCSMWRNILLSTPDLWTAVSSHMTSDCVRAFCSRSGDKPLRLLWQRYARADTETLISAVRDTHARVYQLEITDELLEQHSTAFLDNPMLHLNSLILWNYEDPRVELLDPLQAYDLQELILHPKPTQGVWDFFGFAPLQKLSLDFQQCDEMEFEKFPDLLNSLRNLNTLEELRLGGLAIMNGFEITPEDLELQFPVQLDRCLLLQLSGDQSVVDDLVSVITVPPLARVKLFGILNQRFPAEPSISGTRRALTRTNEASPLSHCTFDITMNKLAAGPHSSTVIIYGEQWELSASRQCSSSTDDREHDFAAIWDDRASETNRHFARATAALSGTCALLALGVRELCLIQKQSSPSVSPQMYHDCFASWALVDRLRVIGTVAAHSMIDGLLSRRAGDNQLVFPRLDVLELVDVNWEVAAEEFGFSLGAKLSKVLQERHEAGKSLELFLVPDVDKLNATSWWGEIRGVARVEQV
ncbi:hypothetical protein PENSPDRAFT_62279 [Peniophora sp. CONT]|nr:hypothetical protein PENSPDRAFT_62279 [Peniophora sp. CONT]